MVQPTVLLCTVGTGDIDKLRTSLLEPLRKSIRQGEWRQVILLPSQLTVESAALLQGEIQDVAITIRPLPQAGAEDNADACFAHFDGILEEVRAAGVGPEAILVDFTRGTKAMSAALVLAAVRHDLPQLRYISGGQRDERGMVVPGTEIIAEVPTTLATARKLLDEAQRFFRHGNFAAVLDILPDPDQSSAPPWPEDLLLTSRFVRSLAAFYAAWDRLDYKVAQGVILAPAASCPQRWKAFVPLDKARQWVADLAQPLPDANKDRSQRLRPLIADLLANGERRIRDRQYEDAVIRGYRVLELLGQVKLLDYDLDSAALPPEHPVVREFQEQLNKKGSQPLASDRRGKLQASREQAARLLKRLGDPVGQRLIDLGNRKEGDLNLARRNYSIWIHGFEAVGGSDPEPLHALYAELEKLLLEDGSSEARSRLALARSLDLSGGETGMAGPR